ncbi:MAG: hypothetical protein RL612_660 [Actinomycetota bacterium]|jgi:hypothetical protein
MTGFEYEHHPHVEKRKVSNAKPLSLNSRIGLFITKSVGTMWAAYAFFALTLVSLPAAIASGSALVMVSWVAQTFLQLVLLPIIIVGQNIQAAASDARAKATYDDATAILHEARQIQSHLLAQDAALEKLIKDLARVEKRVSGK